MKYIIILLTSLFLVSNASASDKKFKSIKETCTEYEDSIIAFQNNKEQAFKSFNNKIIDYQTMEKEIELADKNILFNAKLYHYLDCREELGR